MYNIEFYQTLNGSCDVLSILEDLRIKAHKSKDAHIQYQQIIRYIQLLQDNGTNLPVGIIKHIKDGVWELRPGNNRVFFFHYNKDTYVLLHHYKKKSQKTPSREIKRAIAEMNDYISRKELQNELE